MTERTNGLSQENNTDDRTRAAIQIQRLWRKRNAARVEYMNTDLRWSDAVQHAKLKVSRTAAERGENTPRERWRRSVVFASRLQDHNRILSNSGVGDTGAAQKHLETQHWLELVDGKHRYGSNLKWYHRRWHEEDTAENFFKWLDQGEGKTLSLDQCPRSQLESERITYLSVEQRLNYLVKIDKEGKLRWARNDELVDTAAGHWRDAGNGAGIVPEDMPQRPLRPPRGSFTSVSSSGSISSDNLAAHYVGDTKGKYAWTRALRRHLTPRGIMDRLLRKTVERNTWIYVTDKRFNIFIGIKETGSFQHSSFLAGGLVTSAGLISVKHGLIYTLSPLSGHYRTSINHFHRFIDVMVERGVDMNKARISKAEAALWGIEHIGKWKKAQDRFIKARKQEAEKAAHKITEVTSLKRDGDLIWKREILEGRKRKNDDKDDPRQQNIPAKR